jgi:hypothetical protein
MTATPLDYPEYCIQKIRIDDCIVEDTVAVAITH